MTSWSELPVKILYFIFNQLEERSQLLNCSSVCKDWHEPSQGLIFKTVKLNGKSEFCSFAECIANPHEKEDSTSNLVKKILILNVQFNSTISETYLHNILIQCSNLKNIYVSGEHEPSNYFYNQLMQERYQSRCLLLEGIPSPSLRNDDFSAYGPTAWALRDTLTEMMIRDLTGQANDNDILSKGLGCFPRLMCLK